MVFLGVQWVFQWLSMGVLRFSMVFYKFSSGFLANIKVCVWVLGPRKHDCQTSCRVPFKKKRKVTT